MEIVGQFITHLLMKLTLTAAIRGSGYKFCVKWRSYPGARLQRYLQNGAVILGARLQRYLQNGAVIRMPGFTYWPSV